MNNRQALSVIVVGAGSAGLLCGLELARRAFAAAGAKGIVIAGFPGERLSPAQKEACVEASADGIPIVISTRAGSVRAHVAQDLTSCGMVAADNLNCQKARILL